MDDTFRRPLIIVEGKGGVGKTTLAAALGLALAREGGRTLVLEASGSRHVPRMFGCEPVEHAPVEGTPGLFAQTLVPERCLEEYALLKLHFKAVYRLVFQNPVVKALVRMVPAMDELLTIGKIEYEVRTGGWDHVVVDAPATGEGVLLFQLPRVITEAVSSGPLAEDARRIRELLEDPSRTVMHLVTLAEELPAEETEQLHEAITTRVGVPLGALIVNRVYPRPPAGRARDLALGLLGGGADDDLKDAREVLHFAERRRRQQDRHLARLAHRVPLPLVEVEEVFDAPSERAVLEGIAKCLGLLVRK